MLLYDGPVCIIVLFPCSSLYGLLYLDVYKSSNFFFSLFLVSMNFFSLDEAVIRIIISKCSSDNCSFRQSVILLLSSVLLKYLDLASFLVAISNFFLCCSVRFRILLDSYGIFICRNLGISLWYIHLFRKVIWFFAVAALHFTCWSFAVSA